GDSAGPLSAAESRTTNSSTGFLAAGIDALADEGDGSRHVSPPPPPPLSPPPPPKRERKEGEGAVARGADEGADAAGATETADENG
ncbi:unnamed protein product, partial [Ectocarpus fasciculatus]